MPDRNEDLERFVVQGVRHNRRFVEREGNHDHIQLSALEHPSQIEGEVLFQFQRHLRGARAEQRHKVRQDIGAHRGDDTESERPRQLIFPLSRQDLDLVSLFQDPLGLVDDLFSQGRERNPILPPLEDGCAQFVLQFLNRKAERRLRNTATVRRAPEVALLCHCHDVAKFGQRHTASFFSPHRDSKSSLCGLSI